MALVKLYQGSNYLLERKLYQSGETGVTTLTDLIGLILRYGAAWSTMYSESAP